MMTVEDLLYSEMSWLHDPDLRVTILTKEYEYSDPVCVSSRKKLFDSEIRKYSENPILRFSYDAVNNVLRIVVIGDLII